ncbi:hypothetical protein G6F63_016807 [Rhizopus arrhizus]|nr:hypothetical protein G6F63_016807 [Rhizopus arrhizus]
MDDAVGHPVNRAVSAGRRVLAAGRVAAVRNGQNGGGFPRRRRHRPACALLALCAMVGTAGLSRLSGHGGGVFPDGAQAGA